MNSAIKKLTKTVFNLLWQYRVCHDSRIIYYHSVHPSNAISHRPDMFRSQLQWLSDNNYTCPVLSDFEQFHQQEKVVFITFDDGYLDNLEYAVPILNEFNFKATFFVCSGYINKDNHLNASDGHFLYNGLTMLDEKSLQLIQSAKMEIGSHGVSHYMMSRLSKDEQYQELLFSKETLERLVSQRIISYSYPNGQKGAVTKYANTAAKELGYIYICSTLWGTCNKKTPILHRCEMSHEDDLHDFTSKITGKRDYRAYIDVLVDKSKVWKK